MPDQTTTDARPATGPGLQQPASLPAGGVVYFNGELLPRGQAAVSVDDRGFLFGDGAYEVTRAVNGRLFEGARHRRRLERTLRGLEIECPCEELDRLEAAAERLLAENGLLEGEATVYTQVTRGAVYPRTHWYPPVGTRATIYASAVRFTPPRELRERGASVILQPDIRWARCDLKTVNLLPNAIAKQRAQEAGAYEALFVRDGVVLEGGSTNLFVVLDGELRTAPLTNYILPGITREVVLELAAAEGIAVRHEAVLFAELARATELFLTSTTSDVMPVVRVEGQSIGDGRPGPVARRLAEAFERRMYGKE
jgi:D-alanine transaminase